MTDLSDKQRAAMENAIASLERSIAFWERMQDMELGPATTPAPAPATTPATTPAAAPAAVRAAAPAAPPVVAAAAAQPKAAQARINVAALQAEIRSRFLEFPVHKATGLVLKSIGMYFRADYAAIHARLGVHMLSEEWCREAGSSDEARRELVTDAMLAVTSTGTAKCSRLQWQDGEEVTVLSAPILDEDLEQAGAMSMMLLDCPRERAVELLGVIDSIAGYMGLMIAANIDQGFDPAIFSVATSRANEHPTHVAFTMANELSNGFGLEMVAIGFIHANRVKVVAISGMDEVRASNPGVRLVRAAMEACLDRREAVLFSGLLGDEEVENDCRLHAQWSRAVGGDAVASFPVLLHDQIVAIVSVRNPLPTGIPRALLGVLAETMTKYGPLLPLCRVASRGVTAHLLENIDSRKKQMLGAGRRKTLIKSLVVVSVLAWLFFGSLTYGFTVPCKVRASIQTVISCPREGTLVDLFVRPGDRVRAGQLLAVLDDQDDVLLREEIRAELATLEALKDKALEDGDSGMIRIHEAQKRTMSSRLAVIEHNIELAQIRAPQSGVILEGDLREKLGARLPIGESLFNLAGHDRIAIVLQIPEHLILDARKSRAVVFASSARPGDRMPLEDLQFSPAGVADGGVNVFRAEATTTAPASELTPGMEGFAHVEVGPRPVWWVLTHRISNWFRLRFWV
ncbi:MAG: efflux RND transporter periplasmic adaptor subunit [Planctomycetota bacterium]